ncbi:MAG TPA: penicillin-binding protein 2 [Longimicrobiaceae bacterium]|nr:penicillin-binding protein 2 [Longimicrobiaceae bacterium]
MRLFQHTDPRERRTLTALFTISFFVALLMTAFFNTQVVSGAQYKARSEANRLRPVVIPAPRGTMYDRYGEVVATSIPGFSVSLLPGKKEVIEQTLRDLESFLGLSDAQVAELMETRNARPHDLLPITKDATFSQVSAIEERRTSFPNLLIVDRPKRYYPAGPALGHLVGYVGEISKAELEQEQYKKAGYEAGRIIGKAGLEKEYETWLSGEDGARFVEVDALGRVVNPRSNIEVMPPVPGKDLHLTIDLELQKYLRQIFPDTMRGSIAVMEPGTGAVLGLYSNPSYDPNDFVGSIPLRLWRALQTDPDKPLLDRTINAAYAPGSTWKLATAISGMDRGLVKAETHMPIPCTGGMTYGGRYARCWDHSGHGSLDLIGAIAQSCDVYFYQLGIQIGLANLVADGTRMGFNKKTGIDLPAESPGIFPDPPVRAWWKDHFGNPPQPSDILSLAIGQGPNSQNVLRMAFFYSALASGDGTSHRPHLVQGNDAHVADDVLDLHMTPEAVRISWAGLAQVTEYSDNPNLRGTGWLSALTRWKLYGKTGSAQNPHGADHGWFAGFAGPPGKAPEVVAVAMVEHGMHGADVAPLVAKAAEFYLDHKHHLPIDYTPTKCEKMGIC